MYKIVVFCENCFENLKICSEQNKHKEVKATKETVLWMQKGNENVKKISCQLEGKGKQNQRRKRAILICD